MEVEDAAFEGPDLKREVYYDYIKLKRSYEFGCLLMLGLLLLILPLDEAIQKDITVFESEAAIQDKIQANISEKEVISKWSSVFCWSLEESQLVLVYAEKPLERVIATFEPYNTTNQLRWNAQSSIGWNPRRGVHLYQNILKTVAMLTGGVGYLNYALVEQNQWFFLMPCSAWIGQRPSKNLGSWVYLYVVFWGYFILYIVLYIRIHAFRDVLPQTEYVLEAGIVKLRRREEEHAPLLQ
eukprot:g16134.t1